MAPSKRRLWSQSLLRLAFWVCADGSAGLTCRQRPSKCPPRWHSLAFRARTRQQQACPCWRAISCPSCVGHAFVSLVFHPVPSSAVIMAQSCFPRALCSPQHGHRLASSPPAAPQRPLINLPLNESIINARAALGGLQALSVPEASTYHLRCPHSARRLVLFAFMGEESRIKEMAWWHVAEDHREAGLLLSCALLRPGGSASGSLESVSLKLSIFPARRPGCSLARQSSSLQIYEGHLLSGLFQQSLQNIH